MDDGTSGMTESDENYVRTLIADAIRDERRRVADILRAMPGEVRYDRETNQPDLYDFLELMAGRIQGGKPEARRRRRASRPPR